MQLTNNLRGIWGRATPPASPEAPPGRRRPRGRDRNRVEFNGVFPICFWDHLYRKPFENWKFVTEILHVEFYSKQDQYLGMRNFPFEIARSLSTSFPRPSLPPSAASNSAPAQTETLSGSEASPESLRPPPAASASSRSPPNSSREKRAGGSGRRASFQREPFENWKSATEILHVEFYSKQDQYLGMR